MTLKRVADILTVAGIGFILYIGLNFFIDPVGAAASFGFPESLRPGADAVGMLNVKGDRDIVMGLSLIAVFATRQRQALGWLLLAMTVAPVCDAILVAAHGGSIAVALGVHLATAAVVALTGVLQLRVARDRVAAKN